MNVMKCELDPDGESFLTSSDNQSQLTDIKKGKDQALMKLPGTESENEVNYKFLAVKHDSRVPPSM